MADKLDLVFKKAVSRQYTSLSAKWYEEKGAAGFKLKGSDVWIEPIPGTAQAIAGRIVFFDKLILTKNTDVGANQCWLACNTPGNLSTRIGNFIGPRYDITGTSWGVQLFDGANTPIATSHKSGWFFDYETGILTFDIDPSTSNGGTLNVTNFKVTVYQYVGLTVDDMSKFDATLGTLVMNAGEVIL